MGKPAYIATNLAKAANISFAGTGLSSIYPLANIHDEIIAKTTRFAAGVITLHFEASPFVNYDSLFIGNHNVIAGGSNGFYLRSRNEDPPTGGAAHLPTLRLKNMLINLAGEWDSDFIANGPYLQITPLNVGGPANTEIGEIVVGPRVLFPRAPFWTNGQGVEKKDVTTGITVETSGGIQYKYKLSKYRLLQPTFRFPESEFEAFHDFSNAVEAIPFVYIPDVSSSEAYYVTKPFGFEPRTIGPAMDGSSLAHWYEWTLPLHTESEGILVTS